MSHAPIVWIPSIGKKRPLVEIWRQSLERVGGRLLGSDSDGDCAARAFTHWFVKSPRSNAESFGDWVEDTCQEFGVDWIVPVREAEFSFWGQFAGDVQLLLSQSQILAAWPDKLGQHRWLEEQGLPFLPALNWEEALEQQGDLILKPVAGSGSRGVRRVHASELKNEAGLASDFFIQRFIEGAEFTINLFFDPRGVCCAVVPHQRLATLGGEVALGVTVDDPEIMALGHRFADATGGQCRGPINFQVLREEETGAHWITDINPRFGGGYPLTHAAGAHFVDWAIELFMRGSEPTSFAWESGWILDRRGEAVSLKRVLPES